MDEQQWDAFGEVRVIAPSRKSTRIFLIVFASLTLAGGLITLATAATGVRTMPGIRLLVIGLTLFLMGILLFTILWLWSVNARLLIGRGAVGYRNVFRRSRYWSQSQIGRVVEMAISFGWWTSSPQRGIYIFGRDGRKLVVLTPRMWPARDLRDFIEATGAPVDRRDAPVSIKAINREFPKAFGWVAQHNLATSCLIVLVTVVLLVGYMLVSAAFHH
jgi:hypothetical protein